MWIEAYIDSTCLASLGTSIVAIEFPQNLAKREVKPHRILKADRDVQSFGRNFWYLWADVIDITAAKCCLCANLLLSHILPLSRSRIQLHGIESRSVILPNLHPTRDEMPVSLYIVLTE